MLQVDADSVTPSLTSASCTGTRTPLSQLRQVSFGLLVVLSLTNLPQALSERFAEPTYAQAGQLAAPVDVEVDVGAS